MNILDFLPIVYIKYCSYDAEMYEAGQVCIGQGRWIYDE